MEAELEVKPSKQIHYSHVNRMVMALVVKLADLAFEALVLVMMLESQPLLVIVFRIVVVAVEPLPYRVHVQ